MADDPVVELLFKGTERSTVSKAEPPAGMVVQSIICSKERFKSMADAAKWVKDHGFNVGGGKSEKAQPVSKPAPEETGTSFRFRQRAPGDFVEGSLRTITLTDGVSAVIGRLKPGIKKAEDDMTTEAISKSIDLQGGEELREFINEVQKAVRKLSIEHEDDGGPIMLHGIFTDHLVLRSMGGNFFKTTFERKPDGSVMLGTLERVRMSFSPVGNGEEAGSKGKGAAGEGKGKDAGKGKTTKSVVEIDEATADLITDLL